MTATNFTINMNGGSTQYPVVFVAKLIEQYIFQLKGARVSIDVGPIGTDQKETSLFEKAAGYAIPAYENNWKRKA